MQYPTMQYLTTIQHVPQLDRKLLYYGASWIVAIAISVLCVAVFL